MFPDGTIERGYDVTFEEEKMEFTREEKLKEVAREIALRRRVYPNRILTKRLTQAQADRQIAIMLAIAKDYGGHGDEENHG